MNFPANDTKFNRFHNHTMNHYDTWGNMLIECYSKAEFAEEIKEYPDDHKGLENFAKWHNRLLEARRESGGYYEQF
jgi:hypothetical protein